MAESGEDTLEAVTTFPHYRAGVGSTTGIQILRQRVATAQARAVNRIELGHAVNQRVARTVQGQRGIGTAEGDGCCNVVVPTVVQRQPGTGAGGGDGRIDVDVVDRVQRQRGVGAPGHRGVDVDVATVRACAVVGGQRDVVAGQVARQCGRADTAAGLGTTAAADGEVSRVNQPGADFAGGRQGADLGAIGHLHMGAAGFDEAAVVGAVGRCVQGAANFDRAATIPIAHATQQEDGAARCVDAPGLDHTFVVDHRVQQRVFGAGSQNHRAVVGADQAFVLYQGI